MLTFLLLNTLPIWVSWGYTNGGIVVLEVMGDSPLVGHLGRGERLLKVNDISVGSIREWEDVIWDEVSGKGRESGWCVPDKVREGRLVMCR